MQLPLLDKKLFVSQSKAFLELVCLVSFLCVPSWENGGNTDLDLVEFFSGRARLSKLASWCGLNVRSFDITYENIMGDKEFKRGKVRRAPMDLNGAAGFVKLWFQLTTSFVPALLVLVIIASQRLIRGNQETTQWAISACLCINNLNPLIVWIPAEIVSMKFPVVLAVGPIPIPSDYTG